MFFLSIGSFKTRFQVFRLVYNCIDCYRRIHDKLHGTRHADCFQFIHVNAWSSQLKVFALMLKEFLLQILFHFPYTFSHFSDLSWIWLDEMRRQIAYWLSLHLILLPLSNSFVSTLMAGVYLDIMLTCFIMRSLVGTATDSQNFNYSYCSRFLIPMFRWWQITAIKAKSCKVPQFRTETGSVGLTT